MSSEHQMTREKLQARLAHRAEGGRGNYYKVNFNGLDLSRMDLHDNNFVRASFRGTDLSGANLSGAKLKRADLRGADLREANLSTADLNGAQYSDETKWPEGYEPPPDTVYIPAIGTLLDAPCAICQAQGPHPLVETFAVRQMSLRGRRSIESAATLQNIPVCKSCSTKNTIHELLYFGGWGLGFLAIGLGACVAFTPFNFGVITTTIFFILFLGGIGALIIAYLIGWAQLKQIKA
jgi:hypothetical protein